MKRIAIVVPFRLGSTRLKKKVLSKIHGDELCVHVIKRLNKFIKTYQSSIDVIAAVDSRETKKVLEAAKLNCTVLMTPKKLKSGSDRVHHAFEKFLETNSLKSSKYAGVINLQGDMPFFSRQLIIRTIDKLMEAKKNSELIVTASTPFKNQKNISDLNKVKVISDFKGGAIYFSRFAIPSSRKFSYRPQLHVGIYGFTPAALFKFAKTKQTKLEKSESLEQLRALYWNIPIHVLKLRSGKKSSFRGIDTQADLKWARQF